MPGLVDPHPQNVETSFSVEVLKLFHTLFAQRFGAAKSHIPRVRAGEDNRVFLFFAEHLPLRQAQIADGLRRADISYECARSTGRKSVRDKKNRPGRFPCGFS